MDKRCSCRKAAILSDIHSNYYAFQACYEDAVANGAEMFVFLGDYISDLADPVKTLDLVYAIQKAYPTVCLKGNRERYMLDCKTGVSTFSAGSKTGSLLYTYTQLRPHDFAFFESLPFCDCIEVNGIPFEIAHGFKDDDRFCFDGTGENTETVFAQMNYSWFLGGHCHRQFVCRRGDKVILNPGSVGVPRDYGYLSQYALLNFDGQDVHVQLRQTRYDVPTMIQRQFQSGLVDIAPHWAVSVLYDVITGKECTMELLKRLEPYDIYDELAWHSVAADMGMEFTEDEITAFYKRYDSF